MRDSEGLVWQRIIRKPRYQVWAATPTSPGNASVTVLTRRADGKVFRNRQDYEVMGSPRVHLRRAPWALR